MRSIAAAAWTIRHWRVVLLWLTLATIATGSLLIVIGIAWLPGAGARTTIGLGVVLAAFAAFRLPAVLRLRRAGGGRRSSAAGSGDTHASD